MTVPTFSATERQIPPRWAVEQRELISLMNRTATFFAEQYARPDGTLKWREKWSGMDGTDNGYEIFIPYPLFYLLGGGDHVRELAQKEWDAITWQFTEYGTVDREFVAYFDWFHHSESYPYLFNLALGDPAHHINRSRAMRFAAMYTGDDPLAPNWDAEHKLIRSPINGSHGPRHQMTAEDWVNHRPVLAEYLVPYEDFPGLDSDDPFVRVDWNDDDIFAQVLEMLNQRMAKGDVPLNLSATTLVTHAYLFTGEERLKQWVLDYLSAWMERTQRNQGIMPDNVGLSDEIGEMMNGKWWGGYYGWRWPHGARNILEPALVAGSNAMLMTGDPSWLDLHRSQLDMLWSLRKEEGGTTLLPTRHGDCGWFDYQPITPQHFFTHHHIRLWVMTQLPQDRVWLDTFFPQQEGFAEMRANWPSFKGGPCPPNSWFAYTEGHNPDYPHQILAESREGVYRALERIDNDDADPEDVICNHYHSLIPVVPDGLIQMMMGTPSAVYNGGLLHTSLCYFDPQQVRMGIPDGVAALVDKANGDSVAVTLVNTDPVESRSVLVQSGMFGEHAFTWVEKDGAPRTTVDGKWIEVQLGPCAQIRLQMGLKRFANRPAYGHPHFA
ncbi:MAG: hypothetical protein WBO46_00010 [Caldilineaceae bacterium]